MATAFKLTVQFPNGKKGTYLAANDLEPAIEHRVATRGDKWRQVWLNALFNVPVAPYLPANSSRRRPPIRTVKVLAVNKVPLDDQAKQLYRTRSQFLPAVMWQGQSADKSFNFMHHDHPYWSRQQIKADIDFWTNGHTHPVINLITAWRTKLQWHRLKVANRHQVK